MLSNIMRKKRLVLGQKRKKIAELDGKEKEG